MDWTTPLRSQQADFIQRLKFGCLLHCETEGQHSELTVISGERLKQLRDFCWEMAEKYKRMSSVRNVFINNMKGKLAEEVVKSRLASLVTEVDYEKRLGGDGKVDFTLTSNPDFGIQVKARYGSIDTARWSISSDEVDNNILLVCILIQEDVNEAQSVYNLIMAGYLPTHLIKEIGKASFEINELLYSGGLKSYIENLHSLESESLFLRLRKTQQDGTQTFIQTQNKYVSLDAESRAYAYLSLGLDRYKDENYERAFEDFKEAIRLNPRIVEAYETRASSRKRLGDYQGAIED